MTNVTATVETVVATNWSHIGTFQNVAGQHYYVFEGQFFTNEVGVMSKDEQSVRHVFKSTPGPKLPDQKMQPILGNPDDAPRRLRMPLSITNQTAPPLPPLLREP